MTCRALWVLRWRKPRGPLPDAPLARAGLSPPMPVASGRSWPGCRPSPPLIVLEAPGGLERAATAAWAAAGLPVVVVNPRPARDVARAPGPLAKTEACEARALAHCADVIRPTPRPRPAAQTQAGRALRGRRPPLLGMRTAAPPRLAGARARLTQDITAPLPWRQAALATLDDDLDTLRRASPRWRDHDALVPRAQGMGPVRAPTLRRELPALGTLTRQPIAAWVGVAPLHGDRGTLRGTRTIWGGRAPVRTVLSRAHAARPVSPRSAKRFTRGSAPRGKSKTSP